MDFKKDFFRKFSHRGIEPKVREYTEGRNIFLIFLLSILLSTLVSCVPHESSYTDFAFNTLCTITFFEREKNGAAAEIFSRLHEIESLMSTNILSSDVSRINAAAGIHPVQVHKDVFYVIKNALYFAEISGGAFDPSIGPLVSLWGIGKENPSVPRQGEIDEALALVNWRNIELNEETKSVFLKYPKMALDLGAIAKGYAADEAVRIAKTFNVKRAIIDLGGNIAVIGTKRDKTPWRVGIQNPAESRGIYAGILQIPQDKSIVTSGIYERFFEKNGRHYHHIFSPADGYPAQNELFSVTIISDISMTADALSTAVFVLGYERGKKIIESIPGTQAVFIFNDLTIRVTGDAYFILTDNS